MSMKFEIGSFVKKNEINWVSNDFDGWGRGVRIGTVVLSPFPLDEGGIDVVWEGGRCFEDMTQVLLVNESDTEYPKVKIQRSTIYKEYLEYLIKILKEKNIDDSWAWFMTNRYPDELIEQHRQKILNTYINESAFSKNEVIGNDTAKNVQLAIEQIMNTKIQ